MRTWRVRGTRTALAGAVIASLFAFPIGAAADEGPRLRVTDAEVDTALRCTPDLDRAKRDPVLLTPAFSTADASYGWNYLARLPAIGVPVCSITVPDSGYGDLQRTSEFVVAAVRRMHTTSGRQVVLLGHQHGALDELWALTYWPDVARDVSDLISLATPYNGTTSPQMLCGNGSECAPATRQITVGSNFVRALAAAPLPRGPAYTSITSLDDTLITPQPGATRLDGAENVVLQKLCPGRQVSHFDILADAVAYELVLDAMTHDGPADPSRISPPCGTRLMPGADPVVATVANGFLPIFLAQNTQAAVPSEPESRAYTARRGPTLSVARRVLRRSARRVTVRIGCESIGHTDCQVGLRLRHGGRTVGRTHVLVRPGSSRTIRVRTKLPKAATRVSVLLVAEDALGNQATLGRRVDVRGVRR